jgi:hypothetical protein
MKLKADLPRHSAVPTPLSPKQNGAPAIARRATLYLSQGYNTVSRSRLRGVSRCLEAVGVVRVLPRTMLPHGPQARRKIELLVVGKAADAIVGLLRCGKRPL